MSVATAASQEVIKARVVSPRYKWMVLANTTVGTLLATIDSSIMLIALPAIFHGIHLDPLDGGNSVYLLWMILGYPMVSLGSGGEFRPARRYFRPRQNV